MSDVGDVLMLPIAIFFILCWGFIWAFPLMWAWNYVIPIVFGLTTVTYWQMWLMYAIIGTMVR